VARFDFGAVRTTLARIAARWRERARWTEDTGFASFQLSDHFNRSRVSPLVSLSVIAQATSQIRLGAPVLNNGFRHPTALAKEARPLDLLCDGRLEPALGAGWMDADYPVSRIRRQAAGERVETVAIVDRVLGRANRSRCTDGTTRSSN
jgi:alkanesulfonate monooxygenase SsuD/methylene tetrahydromethanopterin reductase-like flavin-dependent oxidoreductase (luciferase family)